MATVGLRPFVSIPKDLREWTRWCREQILSAGDNTVETATIQDKAVTYAKIQDVAADRILGRLTSLGVVTELTAAQLVTLLQAENWVFAGTAKFSGNVGFYATTPVAQQSDPGSATISTVSGSGDDATINTNFANLDTAIDGIRTALNNLGLTA